MEAPRQPAAGVLSRPLHGWGPDSADRSLHTAGTNKPDRDIRLDLLGPAAFVSGPSRSKESDADRPGVDRVEGGGYGEPNRDGPGSTNTHRYGRVALSVAIPHVAVGTPHRSATTLYKGSVARGERRPL